MSKLSISLNPKEYKRIFAKIFVDKATGCWVWTGGKDSGGYGQGFINGRREKVHRIVYAHFIKPIPKRKSSDKEELDHLCRNRICCNPEHLELVTHRTNALRGTSPVAINAKKTQCKNGHKLHFNGRRRDCRTCDSIRHKKRIRGKNRKYWLNKANEASKRWYLKHKKK